MTTQRICPDCLYTYRPGQSCWNCAHLLADRLVPEGCIAVGNEHGACMDRGCRWCWVYYEGPEALDCGDCKGLGQVLIGPTYQNCDSCEGTGRC